MSLQTKTTRITISSLLKMRAENEKIACLTAYDASFATLLEQAGVELILVGDSLGMVIQGLDTTVPVTMDDMIYHTRCVAQGSQRALLVSDMPFLSYHSPDQALLNAARLMQEGGAQMLKLESGTTQIDIVKRLSDQGVPVCAHLGLRPQSIHMLGGYRVQGTDEQSATQMLEDALTLQQVGAAMLLLECVPSLLAAEITANVDIPVIGIGAGVNCDGQILVLQDILGITPGGIPRFARNFMKQANTVQAAVEEYVKAVKSCSFPSAGHTFQ